MNVGTGVPMVDGHLMLLDIRTLFVTDTAISLALTAVLAFYWIYQKTYEGFGWWTLGSLIMSLGFVGLGIRGLVPEWVGVVISNAAFGLAAVVRFEGTVRFTVHRPIARAWYAVPVLMVILCAYPSPVSASPSARATVDSIGVGLISILIGLQFLRGVPGERRTPYRVLGVLHLLFVTVLVARAILWLLHPEVGMFQPWLPHEMFFLAITLFEVVWAVAFTMVNGNRLESELVQSHSELTRTVDELQKALGEVRTLTGLLPLCSSCRRVRDDEGYWNQIEVYLREHTDVKVSHGLCPECARRLYPDYFPS